MSLATLPDLVYPPPPLGVSGPQSFVDGYQLNAAGEYFALLMQAPIAGVIRKVHVSVSSVISSGDVECRLEGVTTAAAPDGTLLNPSCTDTLTISASGWMTFDFGVGGTVTRGQDVAIVFKNNSVSPANLYLNVCVDVRDQFNSGFPFVYSSAAAGWVSYLPCLAIEYATGPEIPVLPGVIPAINGFTLQWNNSTNPKTRGLKFSLPFPARLVGCWAWIDTSTSGGAGSYTIELFDESGARFATRIKRDFHPLYNAGEAPAVQFFRFTETQTLQKTTDYRLCLTPSGANLCSLDGFDVDDNAYLAAYPGGTAWIHTETNANPPTGLGDWTDTDTRRPMMGLVLDQLHDGVASAGAAILPARRRINAAAQHIRRRLSTIAVTPPPPAVPILVRARRRVHKQAYYRKRVQPTAFSQTIINQTAIIAYSRKVR